MEDGSGDRIRHKSLYLGFLGISLCLKPLQLDQQASTLAESVFLSEQAYSLALSTENLVGRWLPTLVYFAALVLLR